MNNIIKQLRLERGWTQADLADQLEVSRQTINALETGRYDPTCRSRSRWPGCSKNRSNPFFHSHQDRNKRGHFEMFRGGFG